MPARTHPSAVVGPGVELGDDVVVGPFAVLLGPCRVEDGAWLGPHVTLGVPPEIRGHAHPAAWDGELTGAGVVIGARTVLREFTTVHQGSARPTTIGADCFIMNKVYVAHDSVVGDRVTMASTVTMGGHVRVGAGANLGLGAVVHQRRVIGAGAMVGMGAVVSRDLPPFAMAYGNPARVRGANRVGMSREGLSDDVVALVHERYAGPDGDPGEAASLPEPLRSAVLAWRSESGA